jgi:NADPH2:quinone reductase
MRAIVCRELGPPERLRLESFASKALAQGEVRIAVRAVGFTGGIGLARTNLLLIKGASILGVRAGEAARKNPALGEERLKTLLAWAAGGHVRPHISHRLPLEDFAQAMRLLIDRKSIGRVALVMGT